MEGGGGTRVLQLVSGHLFTCSPINRKRAPNFGKLVTLGSTSDFIQQTEHEGNVWDESDGQTVRDAEDRKLSSVAKSPDCMRAFCRLKEAASEGLECSSRVLLPTPLCNWVWEERRTDHFDRHQSLTCPAHYLQALVDHHSDSQHSVVIS